MLVQPIHIVYTYLCSFSYCFALFYATQLASASSSMKNASRMRELWISRSNFTSRHGHLLLHVAQDGPGFHGGRAPQNLTQPEQVHKDVVVHLEHVIHAGTSIHGPTQSHDVLVRQVVVRIHEVTLDGVAVSPILVGYKVLERLLWRFRQQEDHLDGQVLEPSAAGSPAGSDGVPLGEVVSRRMN
uniref:Putative secreted protein n=1 Tax=Ixodes ricinus TaxID=34613 RepID=A0A6B0V0C1_IXORI